MQTAETPRVKRAHGVETQRALLVAAGTVFSQIAYSQARLKDIADTAGISPGSLYFHFGNKDDIAHAVLDVQQERMGEVLVAVQSRPGDTLSRLLALFEGLAQLIASDELVQAGIRLSTQPGTGLELDSRAPYVEWVDVAAQMIREGKVDGSISPDVDTMRIARFLNEVFVGAQTLAGLEDNWKSLPRKVKEAEGYLRLVLTKALEG